MKSTGIGTLVSMMLPYSLAFLVSWTGFLLIYWALGFPLGLQAPMSILSLEGDGGLGPPLFWVECDLHPGGTMNPTIDLILSHRSIRQFTPEPVSAEQLDQILSAAQSAASSSFLQANSIIRVTDKGLRATLAELAGHQAYVVEAAEFLVFCADYHRHSQIVPEARTGFVEQLMIGAIDGALMAQNALLAAQSLGLGGLYRRHSQQSAEVSEVLGLPHQVIPLFGLCLGHPAQRPEQNRGCPGRWWCTRTAILPPWTAPCWPNMIGQIHDYYQAQQQQQGADLERADQGHPREGGQTLHAGLPAVEGFLPQVMGRRAIWSMTPWRWLSPPGCVVVRQAGIWALPYGVKLL